MKVDIPTFYCYS